MITTLWKNYNQREEESRNGPSNVSFPGLFGGKSYELMSTKEVPDQISKNIIRDDEKSRNNVPNEPFIKIMNHQPALH